MYQICPKASKINITELLLNSVTELTAKKDEPSDGISTKSKCTSCPSKLTSVTLMKHITFMRPYQ